MKALDLFCGAGGTARGLLAAGFERVVGIDCDRRCAKHYPGDFIQGDALHPPARLEDFDFVFASPPCQAFCASRKPGHPNLIPQTRALLKAHPWTTIENVPTAPIRADLELYGPMVGLNFIQRRRFFELSFFVLQPPIQKIHPSQWASGEIVTITSSMSSKSHYYPRRKKGLSGRVPMDEARQKMGMEPECKMNAKQLANAVAPPMAQYIGEIVLNRIRQESA